jgi:uncharacterized protein YbjT (DUF2867 family)
MKTALLAGASGLVGSALLPMLLAHPEYDRVISLGRKTLDLHHPKLTQIIVDFNDLSSFSIPCHHVYCCLGTTIRVAGSKEKFFAVDHDYPLNLAKATLRSGAECCTIITAVGAKADSSVFYSSVKGKVEQELMKLGFRSVNILRPSMLLGNRQESRPAEWISKHLMTILAPIIPRSYRAVRDVEVAASMITHTLHNPGGIRVVENAEILGSEV